MIAEGNDIMVPTKSYQSIMQASPRKGVDLTRMQEDILIRRER